MKERIEQMSFHAKKIEVDYEAEVKKAVPTALLDVQKVGYGSPGHKEFRICYTHTDGKKEYIGNVTALSADNAWKYAWEELKKNAA